MGLTATWGTCGLVSTRMVGVTAGRITATCGLGTPDSKAAIVLEPATPSAVNP